MFFKRFAIPDNPFSIPTNSDSETFSSLVKSILRSIADEEETADEDKKNLNEDLNSIEFDFYINGEFVYTNLAKFIEEAKTIKTVT